MVRGKGTMWVLFEMFRYLNINTKFRGVTSQTTPMRLGVMGAYGIHTIVLPVKIQLWGHIPIFWLLSTRNWVRLLSKKLFFGAKNLWNKLYIQKVATTRYFIIFYCAFTTFCQLNCALFSSLFRETTPCISHYFFLKVPRRFCL